MTTHLVIGASGLVGEHLLRVIEQAGDSVTGTYRTYPVKGLIQLDARDEGSLIWMVEKTAPDIIYLPASMANVDYVETHAEEAYSMNVLTVRNVVQAANSVGAKVVYFSTDYVFDGKTGGYSEQDPANPICVYGVQKLLAEHYLAMHAKHYLILRTTGVYGWEHQKKNFIYRLLQVLGDGKVLKVPVDQIGTPTYAPDLARAAVELASHHECDIYHVAGTEEANRLDYAVYAAQVFGLPADLIQPLTTDQLGQTAPRPLHGGLNVSKAVARLTFPLNGFRSGLCSLKETYQDISNNTRD